MRSAPARSVRSRQHLWWHGPDTESVDGHCLEATAAAGPPRSNELLGFPADARVLFCDTTHYGWGPSTPKEKVPPLVAADVTVPEEVERLVDTVVSRHGGLHVAFNCAGVFGVTAPVADLDPDTWSKVLNVNLTGTFLSMKYEIAHMKAHGGGVIVNMGANIGVHGRRPGLAAYAATTA